MAETKSCAWIRLNVPNFLYFTKNTKNCQKVAFLRKTLKLAVICIF